MKSWRPGSRDAGTLEERRDQQLSVGYEENQTLLSLKDLAGVSPVDVDHRPARGPQRRALLETLEKRCLLSADVCALDSATDAALYQGRLKLRGENAQGVTVTVQAGDDGSISGTISSPATGAVDFSGALNRRRFTVQLDESGESDGVLTGRVSRNGVRLRGRLADGPDGASGRLNARATSSASARVLAADDDLVPPDLGPPQEPPTDTPPTGGELPPTDTPPGGDPGTDPGTDPGSDPVGGGPFPGMPDLPPPRWEVGLGPKPDIEGSYSGEFAPLSGSAGKKRGTGVDPVLGWDPVDGMTGGGLSFAATNSGASMEFTSQSETGGLEGTLSIPGVGDFTFTGKLGFAFRNEFRLIVEGDGAGYVSGVANNNGGGMQLVAEFIVNTSSGEQRGALAVQFDGPASPTPPTADPNPTPDPDPTPDPVPDPTPTPDPRLPPNPFPVEPPVVVARH